MSVFTKHIMQYVMNCTLSVVDRSQSKNALMILGLGSRPDIGDKRFYCCRFHRSALLLLARTKGIQLKSYRRLGWVIWTWTIHFIRLFYVSNIVHRDKRHAWEHIKWRLSCWTNIFTVRVRCTCSFSGMLGGNRLWCIYRSNKICFISISTASDALCIPCPNGNEQTQFVIQEHAEKH